MLVLLVTLRLRAPWCQSLKDKRSETRRLLSALKGKFNVSAVESGLQDVLTLIEISAAALAFNAAQADSMYESICAFAQASTQAELYACEKEMI